MVDMSLEGGHEVLAALPGQSIHDMETVGYERERPRHGLSWTQETGQIFLLSLLPSSGSKLKAMACRTDEATSADRPDNGPHTQFFPGAYGIRMPVRQEKNCHGLGARAPLKSQSSGQTMDRA